MDGAVMTVEPVYVACVGLQRKLTAITLPANAKLCGLEDLDALPLDADVALVTSASWLKCAGSPLPAAVTARLPALKAWFVVLDTDSSAESLLYWMGLGATDLLVPQDLGAALAQCVAPEQEHVLFWMSDEEDAIEQAPLIDALRREQMQVLTHHELGMLSDKQPTALLCADPDGFIKARAMCASSGLDLPVIVISDTPLPHAPISRYERVLKSAAPELVASQLAQIVRRTELTTACPRSVQLLRVLDEHAIVSIADKQGRITAVNERFCQISGYTRDELIGNNHRLVKSGLHDEAFYKEMWATLKSGGTWHGIVCNRTKEGSLYWVEATIVPFFNSAGQIEEFCSIRTDITALKESEDELRRHDEMLTQSQNFANVGSWDWNIQTGELYWSERIPPLFGYEQGKLETSYANFIQAIHPDDRQAVEAAVAASLESGQPYEVEHRVIWPDGAVRWLLERGAVTRDHDGRPLHMLGMVQDIHDRKVTELELASSQHELAEANTMMRLVLDTIPARVFWKNRDLSYLGGNRAFCNDAGLESPEQLVGLSDYDMPWASWEAEAYRADDQTVIEQSLPQLNYEEHQTSGDGRQAWLRTSKIPLQSASGDTIGLLGVYEDITETRLAQQQLRASEERFSFAVEGAGDGIWDWNIITGAMTFSRLYMEMLGYDEFELPHHQNTWASSVHPDDWERVSRYLQEYLDGQHANYSIQLRLRCKDGRYKWVLCRGTVVDRDPSGEPQRMIGIHADISEQKQVEENLDLFRQVFDACDQCMAIADSKGTVIFVNQAYLNTMKYAAEQVVGKNFRGFISKTPEAGNMVADTLVYHHRSWTGLTTRQRSDGSEFIAANSFGLVKDEADNITYIFVIFSDFTQELERRNELALAKEAAETANKAKSDFLSSMSHELRTPMNAVIGFAQLLECDEGATEDQLDNVHEILKAGRHLLELINEVLDLAKIESGRVDLSLEEVEIEAVIMECYDLVRPLAERRGLEFDLQVQPQLQLMADRVRLKQVLLNLISNAIKYNCFGGRVSVCANNAGGMARVSVSDTGMGIAQSRLPELFLPFNRLSAGASDIEGTGIGLTITQRLIQMMGGEIGVESREGKGSSFWFELPIAEMSERGDEDLELVPLKALDISTDADTVLCIDDNPANLKLISQILARQKGLKILTALEPELGIELALAHRPALILLDINMPRMDGYEVLKVLRARKEVAHVPVIAVTANAMTRDIQRGMEAGFADYLTKPLNMTQTLDLINKHLEATGQERNSD